MTDAVYSAFMVVYGTPCTLNVNDCVLSGDTAIAFEALIQLPWTIFCFCNRPHVLFLDWNPLTKQTPDSLSTAVRPHASPPMTNLSEARLDSWSAPFHFPATPALKQLSWICVDFSHGSSEGQTGKATYGQAEEMAASDNNRTRHLFFTNTAFVLISSMNQRQATQLGVDWKVKFVEVIFEGLWKGSTLKLRGPSVKWELFGINECRSPLTWERKSSRISM